MSINPNDLDDDDSQLENNAAGWRKRMEAENRDLKDELAKVRREYAFTGAGIDPNDPKASYFVKGYDGPMTPEAVKAEAVRVGVLTDTPKVTPEELAQHQSAANLPSGGGVPVSDPTLPKFADPAHADEYRAALAKARNQNEVLQVMAEYGSPAQILEDWA